MKRSKSAPGEAKASRHIFKFRSNHGHQESRLQQGKIGWLFLWLVGVPVPILVILFLVRGCT